MGIKQSICHHLYLPEGMGRDELFAAWARMGGAAIELWGWDETLDEIAATANKHGLAVASMGGGGGGLNDPANHDNVEAALRRSIDKAVEIGVPGLICMSGNVREGVSEEDAIQATADGLARVAPYAEKHGVNLNLELLNSKVNHPGYQCDHTAWGVEVVTRVNSPRVKLLYDIYHMQIMEGDVISTIRENIDHIGHFHTAGVPGRHDLDDEQELNYRGICKAISDSGYDGYVGHEFWAKGDKIDALRQAFEICDVRG